MIFFSSRRKTRRQAIAEAETRADAHLERAQRIADEAMKIGQDLKATRIRNHIGESIADIFQTTRRRRGMPWTR